jgi:hypothetical protein
MHAFQNIFKITAPRRLRAKRLSPERRQEIAKTAGEARMERISPKRRAEIAKAATAKRWAGHDAKRPAAKRTSNRKKKDQGAIRTE